MANEWDIEDWVQEAASSHIAKFYPTAVAKDTQLPLGEVFKYLLKLVETNKLKLLWEVRCPNLDCVSTIGLGPDKFHFKNLNCSICGDEIEVTPDIVFPVFEITPEYRDRQLAQKKTSKQKTLYSMARGQYQQIHHQPHYLRRPY